MSNHIAFLETSQVSLCPIPTVRSVDLSILVVLVQAYESQFDVQVTSHDTTFRPFLSSFCHHLPEILHAPLVFLDVLGRIRGADVDDHHLPEEKSCTSLMRSPRYLYITNPIGHKKCGKPKRTHVIRVPQSRLLFCDSQRQVWACKGKLTQSLNNVVSILRIFSVNFLVTSAPKIQKRDLG